MEYNLNRANRDNGSWLPGVKGCTDRLKPCGNARCMDMAMAAAELHNNGDYASEVVGGERLAQAAEFARRCSDSCRSCPLGSSAERVVYTLFNLQTQ